MADAARSSGALADRQEGLNARGGRGEQAHAGDGGHASDDDESNSQGFEDAMSEPEGDDKLKDTFTGLNVGRDASTAGGGASGGRSGQVDSSQNVPRGGAAGAAAGTTAGYSAGTGAASDPYYDEDADYDEMGNRVNAREGDAAASNGSGHGGGDADGTDDGVEGRRRRRGHEDADDLEDSKKDATLANACKEEGNRHYSSGDWVTAAACYTEALRYVPRDPMFDKQRAVFFSNRAASNLNIPGKLEDALYDCDRALELDSTYVKALVRRSNVLERLEKLDEACKDLEAWVALEPSNRAAVAGVERLKKMMAERDEKLKEEMLGKLKDLGNTILGKFGLSLNNFNAVKDPNTGSYSISFNQNK